MKRLIAAGAVSVAALLFASAAQAESGTLSVAGASATALAVQENVTVEPSDCQSNGFCGWFPVATINPATAGCSSNNGSNLIWVGQNQDSAGPSPGPSACR